MPEGGTKNKFWLYAADTVRGISREKTLYQAQREGEGEMKILATLDRPAPAPRVQEVRKWVWPYDGSYPIMLLSPPTPEHLFALPGRGDVVLSLNADVFPLDLLERTAERWKGKPVLCEHWDMGRHEDHIRENYVGYIESAISAPGGKILGVLRVVDLYWRARLLRIRLEGKLGEIGLSINGAVRVLESNGFHLVTGFESYDSVDITDRPAAGGHFLPI